MTDFIHSTVVALYVHGHRSSRPEDRAPTPMLTLERVEVVPGRGIKQDTRFFRPADPGRVRKRQVSLIDEGTLRRHEARFGPFDWRFVKSQIVLSGDIHLPDLIGATMEFEGGPRLSIVLERDPCFAMDLIVPGMREAMLDGEQGVLATVLTPGEIWVGQPVLVGARVDADRIAREAVS